MFRATEKLKITCDSCAAYLAWTTRCTASAAPGINFFPRIRTPSISKAMPARAVARANVLAARLMRRTVLRRTCADQSMFFRLAIELLTSQKMAANSSTAPGGASRRANSESMGWLTESAGQPKIAKPIAVQSGSVRVGCVDVLVRAFTHVAPNLRRCSI